MAIDIKIWKKKLVINHKYLARFSNVEELFRTLDRDLAEISNGGEVHLCRPKDSGLNPLFSDALSYICAHAINGNYIMKPTNNYDVSKIRAILGGNIVGDLQQGYRFQKQD